MFQTSLGQAVIEKTGGSVEFSEVMPNPGANDADAYPVVSTVELPPELSVEFDPGQGTVFDEGQIRFIGDTADFLDLEAAKAALIPAAEYLKSHHEFKALLVGTTAGGNNKEYCRQLYLDRAVAVQNALISLGVPEGQIMTIGLGDEDPWHIPDRNSDGTYIRGMGFSKQKGCFASCRFSGGCENYQ